MRSVNTTCVSQRRRFIGAAASLFVLAHGPVVAQPVARKVWRIGFLGAGNRPPDAAPPAALRLALRDLGYVDGENIVFVGRWAESRPERLPAVAAELAALKVDLIVTFGWKSANALHQLSSNIPIVFVGSGDPVATGLTASFSRPGGNVTGVSDQSEVLSSKRLELLKEAVPQAARIAVLWNADDLAMSLRYKEVARAASVLQVSLQPLGVREPEDFDSAFAAMRSDPPDALVLLTDLLTNLNRRRVLEFAAERQMPTMYEYAPDIDEMYRRAAVYVDRIVKGALPAELPVEQPAKFYLLLNLKTAKALGLTVPQSLLLRADEAIS